MSCQVESSTCIMPRGQVAVKIDDGTENVISPGDFFYVPLMGSERYAAGSS